MVQAIKAGCQEAEAAWAAHLIIDSFKLPERVIPLSSELMCFSTGLASLRRAEESRGLFILTLP